MVSAHDSKADSEVQGEIQWADSHAQISREPTKTPGATPIHIWKPTKTLNDLGADGVSIALESKHPNPGEAQWANLHAQNLLKSTKI